MELVLILQVQILLQFPNKTRVTTIAHCSREGKKCIQSKEPDHKPQAKLFADCLAKSCLPNWTCISQASDNISLKQMNMPYLKQEKKKKKTWVVVVEVPIVVEREGGGARLGRSDVVVAFAAFPFPITVDDCWEVPDLSSLPNRRENSVSCGNPASCTFVSRFFLQLGFSIATYDASGLTLRPITCKPKAAIFFTER